MLRTFTTVSLLALFAAACGSTTSADNGSPTDGDDSGSPADGDDSGSPTNGDAGTPALPSAVAVTIGTGSSFACALTSAGEVRCWGDPEKGQIGNGTPYATMSVTVPAQVTGLASGVKSLGVGSDFACAVLAGGNVKCWGNDDSGQLGTGKVYTDSSMKASNVPVDVINVTGATAVSAGFDSACAIVAGGAVKCWGYDEYGKLGNNSQHQPGNDSLPDASPPVDVMGLTGATQISVGSTHVCAVLGSGSVSCWGNNSDGQLGIGLPGDQQVDARTPAAVPKLASGVVKVAAGRQQSCAVLASGALQCWGDGSDGYLGDGHASGTPDEVLSPQPVLGVASGGTDVALSEFACGVIAGAAKCWGKAAELGTGDDINFEEDAPAKAATGLETGTKQVSVGVQFACALTTAGAVKCWGANGVGEGGTGNGGVNGSEGNPLPTPVLSLP